ncbi:MAG: hypothetical protein ACI9BD_000024 [Candidatus Marinamargulisbacteria bacterium]|jgi:hypothetical protein
MHGVPTRIPIAGRTISRSPRRTPRSLQWQIQKIELEKQVLEKIVLNGSGNLDDEIRNSVDAFLDSGQVSGLQKSLENDRQELRLLKREAGALDALRDQSKFHIRAD